MLRDVIGEAGLSIYPQLALILFILVFFSICIYVFMKKRSDWDAARYMPLQDTDQDCGDRKVAETIDGGKDEADG
jgi:cbb3-type cytochrome oxidase subunit 3